MKKGECFIFVKNLNDFNNYKIGDELVYFESYISYVKPSTYVHNFVRKCDNIMCTFSDSIFDYILIQSEFRDKKINEILIK